MVEKLIGADAVKETANVLFGDPIIKMAVDAVVDATPEVDFVHCGDCRQWKDSWVAPDGKSRHGYCHLEDADGVIVGRWSDDFCSNGERRSNG